MSGQSTGEYSGDGRPPCVSLGQVSAFIQVKMPTSDSMPHSSESLLYQLHANHKNKCHWQAIKGCQGQIFKLICVASSKPLLHLTRSDVVPETNQPCCTPSLSANVQNFHSGETKAELMKKNPDPHVRRSISTETLVNIWFKQLAPPLDTREN